MTHLASSAVEFRVAPTPADPQAIFQEAVRQ
jgi:hypothetical protein